MTSWGHRAIDALFHPNWIWRRLQWSWMLRRSRPSIRTVRTANGLISFDTRDHTIGRALYIKRQYEMDLIRDAMRALRRDGYLDLDPSGCVLDVGANIGIISIALIKERYFSRALAIEPDPENFALLERNVRQNELESQVRCLAHAVSNRTGTLLLARSENWGGHYITQSEDGALPVQAVQAITLDELVAHDPELRAPDSVSLIWIDVEGYEAWCLAGARQLLARRIPVVSEFWADGMARAGTTASDYAKLTAELFTHFYVASRGSARGFMRYPIGDISLLFDRLSREREHNIILVNAG